MKWAMAVYGQYVKISFSSALAYRANFIFVVLISFLSNMLLPLVTILIYRSGAVIPGWTFHEALLIQGVFMLCTGFCSPLFYNMVWVTMSHVADGTYDLLMIKPGSIIWITLAKSFELESIGVFLGGIAMFVYALLHVPAVGLLEWVKFIYLFILGVMFSLGLVLMMAASTFKWVGNSRIFEMYDSLTTFGRYPGTIFSKLLMNITTYIFPVAMLGFLPATALLGKAAPGMLAASIPCAGFMFFGMYVFKKMIFLYQSAGG